MEFRNRKKDAVVDMFSDHIHGDDEDLTLEDTLASDEDFVEDMLENENFNNKKKIIYEVLNSLDKRDRLVIEYLYGFKTGSPLTQVEVAEIFGLSQSYIARLSKSIEKTLAEKLEDLKEEYGDVELDNMLDEYDDTVTTSMIDVDSNYDINR